MKLDVSDKSGSEASLPPRKPYAIYAVTRHGAAQAVALAAQLPDSELFLSHKFIHLAPERARLLPLPMGEFLKGQFTAYDCHIFIISVGAVVRMIAPALVSKKVDPAVLCVDDDARFVICTLSGHVGRGNAFTQRVAAILGATPVVTTASDVRGTLTVDILGRDLGWTLADPDFNVTRGCAAVVNEEPVAVIQECGEPQWWPLDQKLPPAVEYHTALDGLNPTKYGILLLVTDRKPAAIPEAYRDQAVIYHPKTLVLGIGCDRGTPLALLEEGVLKYLDEYGLALASVSQVASIDLKADEPGLLALCSKYGWVLTTYTAKELDQVEGVLNPSETVKKHTGTRGVAEPAALLGAQASELTITKQKYTQEGAGRSMTFAVARISHQPRLT